MEFYEYYAEVRKHPKLYAWDVSDIVEKKSCEDAQREILTRSQQHLCHMVESWLTDCERYGIDPMDMVSAGNIGLLKGMPAYFAKRRRVGYRRYTNGFIRGYIENEFYVHTISSRKEGRKKIGDYRKSQDLYKLKGGHLPECANLNPVILFSSIVEENGENEDDNLTMEDILSHPDDKRAEIFTEVKNLLALLKKANVKIHPKAQEIIELRYGVGSRRYCEPLSLSETGKIVHYSKEGVRNIENKVLEFLRKQIYRLPFGVFRLSYK